MGILINNRIMQEVPQTCQQWLINNNSIQGYKRQNQRNGIWPLPVNKTHLCLSCCEKNPKTKQAYSFIKRLYKRAHQNNSFKPFDLNSTATVTQGLEFQDK